MKRLFLDTNILVDLICHRTPFVEEAEQLFALAYIGRIGIGVSALSFINTVYIAKKYNYQANEVISKLKELTSFITITHLTETTIEQAIDCGWNDFEDAVQYYSSQPFSADYM